MIERLSKIESGIKEKGRSIDELLAMVQEGGSPDLSQLSQAERLSVLDWYKSNQLSEKDQVDFLEEFIRYDLVDDNTCRELIGPMNEDQKKQLGEYLGRLITPGKYLHSFYECWPELDFETQREFNRLFIKENPENAIMVSPFRKLEFVKVIERGENKIESKPILESAFHAIEDASKLLDALLKYYEDHPDIQIEKLEDNNSRDRYGYKIKPFVPAEARNIKEVVDYYLNKHPLIIYPYIERLLNLDLIEPEEVTRLFNIKDTYRIMSDRTKEEDAQIKKLKKELKTQDERTDFYNIALENTPRYYGFRIEEIMDRGLLRGAKNILGNFKEYKARFKFNHTDFLVELIEWGVPVFSMIDSLGLTKEEIRVVISRARDESGFPFCLHGYGDLKNLLEWNRKEPGLDLEKFIADLLARVIVDGDYTNVMLRLGEILEWFEEPNRNKIIKAINQRTPHLWLINLRYAIEHRVIPVIDLIKLSSADGYYYLNYFNNLLYQVAILKKEGKVSSAEVDLVKETARKIILEEPYYFINKEYKSVVDQVFNPEEKANFIDLQLRRAPLNAEFMMALINSDGFEEYKDKCKSAILNDPRAFGEIAERTKEKLLGSLFSVKESVDLMIKNTSSLNFENLIDLKFSEKLLKNPKELERLLASMKESGNAHGLIAVATILAAFQRSATEEIENWASSLVLIKQSIKSHKYLQIRATEDVDKEIYTERIHELKKELSKVQARKPQKSRPNELTESAQLYEIRVKQDLKQLCQEKKFFIFEKDVLEVLDKDAEDIIRRDIEEYVAIHPDILLREYPSHYKSKARKLVFKEILGEGEFSRLFKSRIRSLAFWRGKYKRTIDVDRLPDELKEEVLKLNPVLFLKSHGRLEKDFYQTTLEVVKNHDFYSLYSGQLEKISAEEIGIYGLRLDMNSFDPKEEFMELTKTIFLFQDSALARKNKEAILKLSKEQQGEFVKILEFAVLYHLDEDIDFDLSKQSYAEVKKTLLSIILEFSKKLFEVEDVEISLTIPPSIEAINALSVYYDKSCRNNLKMKEGFRKIIIPILGGGYKNWRAGGVVTAPEDKKESLLENLKAQNLVPKNISLDQYEQWLKDDNFNFNETFTYQISDIQSGVVDILSLAVVDGHIEKEAINTDSFVLANSYQELIRPIRDLAKIQQEFRGRIQASKKDKSQALTPPEELEYDSIKKQIKDYKSEHELDIKKIEALRYLDKIRRITLEELELKALIIDQKRFPLQEAFKAVEEVFQDKPDFLSDIKRMRDLLSEGNRQIFQGERVSRSQLMLKDQVDLETHVLIGAKPVGSCQHYNGSDLNQGLLSYISDPSIKIAQIWDENGSIIARSILRLMEDDSGAPQLFMERVYSVNTHPKIKEAIVRFAIKKAKVLGVGLYTQEGELKYIIEENMDVKESITLYSRGSRSPYTYTDAGGGKAVDGVFKVEIFN